MIYAVAWMDFYEFKFHILDSYVVLFFKDSFYKAFPLRNCNDQNGLWIWWSTSNAPHFTILLSKSQSD